MSIQKKYNREEISKILKIASDLDKENLSSEDGLTELELKKIAEETGLSPELITKAIFRMEHGETSVDMSLPLEEYNKFKNSFLVEGQVDDALWEEIVSEIRATHGGIGKVSKMGSTYQWEQRKQNVGYIQISITPKNDHSKVSINSNYTYLKTLYGFIGGLGGFTSAIMLSEGFGLFFGQGDILFAFLGGILGWVASRFVFKNWMKRKTSILKHMSRRLAEVIKGNKISQETGIQPEIELDGDEFQSTEESLPKSKQVRE